MIKKDTQNSLIIRSKGYDPEAVVTMGYFHNYMSVFRVEFKNEIMTDFKIEMKKQFDEFRIEFKDELKGEIMDDVRGIFNPLKRDFDILRRDVDILKEQMSFVISELADIKSMLVRILKYIEVNEDDKAVVSGRLDKLESRLLLA